MPDILWKPNCVSILCKKRAIHAFHARNMLVQSSMAPHLEMAFHSNFFAYVVSGQLLNCASLLLLHSLSELAALAADSHVVMKRSVRAMLCHKIDVVKHRIHIMSGAVEQRFVEPDRAVCIIRRKTPTRVGCTFA